MLFLLKSVLFSIIFTYFNLILRFLFNAGVLRMSIKKILVAGLSTIACSAVFAAPSSLTTHNQTSHESNAYIAGHASPYPVAAKSDRSISWTMVRLACFGHTSNNVCAAEVFMETETSNKVSIGHIGMNLSTGEISPSVLDTDKYHLEVNGPGEVTITEK